MKLFGSLTELVTLIFRKNSQTITVRPNNATTYTAARTVDLPAQDANSTLVSRDSTDTLTNKSISGSTNTLTNIPAATAITGQLPTANGGTGVTSTATFPTTGVVVTEAATETLTNKTIDGNNNTLTNVSLTTGVTGTLPITNGGTGQTSQTNAFDALAPSTTKGDIIVYNGTDNVRFPAGTNTFVLSANSAQSTGLEWVASSTSTASPTSQGSVSSYFPVIQSATLTSSSTTINISTTDGYQTVIATSTSDVTINLPAAASNPGRILTVIKTGSTGKVTLDPNSTEVVYTPSTPAGVSTYPMLFAGEKITISCDGTGWHLIGFMPVIMLSAYLTSPQSRSDGTSYDVEFDTFDINLQTQFATSTFTAIRPGRYLIQSTVNISRTSTGSLAQASTMVRKTGSTVRSSNWSHLAGASGITATFPLNIACVVSLAASDTIQIRVFGSSFGSTNYQVDGSAFSMLTITQLD